MQESFHKKITIGINAYNIRAGGGITHLSEILNNLEYHKLNIEHVVLWAPSCTLLKIQSKPWLKKISTEPNKESFIVRYKWLIFKSKNEFIKNKVDILLVPGGTYLGSFKPFVTINQNLLPFESKEISRYGFSLNYLKFHILRKLQCATNLKADAIIFLTKYAQNKVLSSCNILNTKNIVIPHGINPKFNHKPTQRIFRNVADFTDTTPCKILYVSSIEVYKHQLKVIQAVEELVSERFCIKLTLIGPPGSASSVFFKKLKHTNPNTIEYKGYASYDTIQNQYLDADIGIFASSCETFGMITTEALFCSLPLAASNMSAIPDVLGNAAIYFNPENIDEIKCALKKMYNSADLRKNMAIVGYSHVQKFDWQKSAIDTFLFLNDIFINSKNNINA